jgi:hypothetical protein
MGFFIPQFEIFPLKDKFEMFGFAPKMRILLVPFPLLFLLALSNPAFCQTNYSRYETFSSLSFSYPELAGIIKDAENLLRSVNAEAQEQREVEIEIRKLASNDFLTPMR